METANLWALLVAVPTAWLLGLVDSLRRCGASAPSVSVYRAVCGSCGEALAWRLFRSVALLDAMVRNWHVTADRCSCFACDSAAAESSWRDARAERLRRKGAERSEPAPVDGLPCERCGALLAPWDDKVCGEGCKCVACGVELAPGGTGNRCGLCLPRGGGRFHAVH